MAPKVCTPQDGSTRSNSRQERLCGQGVGAISFIQ